MRSLLRARRSGRDLRDRLDPDRTLDATALFERLAAYLWDVHRVESKAVDPRKLQGGRGEVKAQNVFYNWDLDADPAARLRVVAHETGHLERHDRLRRLDAEPDPTRSGSYLANEHVPAVARYSPGTREEAEADAFALEFVCPSDDAFRLWRVPGATSITVARTLGVARGVARAQLVEALYRLVSGVPDEEDEAPAPFDLDDDQQPAAYHGSSGEGRKPALVLAGPGSGKTATLVARVVWAIASDVERLGLHRDDAAAGILALTFSNEAAGELEARVGARLGIGVAEKVTAATFHSFCRHLVCQHGHRLVPLVDAQAPILDDVAQEGLLLDAFATAGTEAVLDLKDLEGTAAEARRHVDYLKQRLSGSGPDAEPWTPTALRHRLDALKDAAPAVDRGALREAEALCTVFEAYETAKGQAGALDFADLVALALRLLRTCPDIRDAYRARFRHVLVDEFQDVSRAVGALLAELCGPDNPPWVVGDPNQAIYRFLNAAPENVTGFEDAFPGSEVYRLRHNYRSAPQVVEAANQLATLLADPDASGPGYDQHLLSKGGIAPFGDGPVVRLAVAESDHAEVEGVARQVEAWLAAGAEPHDVAVLCRRNVDVRDVVLALGKRDVWAVAAGLLTPEGAAGDLAVVVMLQDGGAAARRAGLTRLAYALGRDRYSPDVIDGVAAALCDLASSGKPLREADLTGAHPLLGEAVAVDTALAEETYAGDAFDMMAAFLFDAGDYLRRLLDSAEGLANSAPQLSEVVATLRLTESMTAVSRAAAHRMGHEVPPDADVNERARLRRRARREFGGHFRRRLTDAAPTARTPRRVEGAVQVMTCHAAKGLEFPCVCVVGQTVPQVAGGYGWLPAELQPPDEQDVEQADALLFVGVTRAQRALTVSYAEARTAGGRRRSPARLLARWVDAYAPHAERWEERDDDAVPDEVVFGAVWGVRRPVRLDARAVSPSTCATDTYVSSVAKLRLPEGEPAVYPLFFDAVREALRLVVAGAHGARRALRSDEADAFLDRTWRTVVARREGHRHLALFERLARQYLRAFAAAYQPLASLHRPIDLDALAVTTDPDVSLPLKLAAAFWTDDGVPVAILFRVESYADKLARDGSGVAWAKMATPRRLPLVLLREQHPGLIPYVFSGTDGVLYRYLWSTTGEKSMTGEADKAAARLSALLEGRYMAAPDPWACDRCGSRLVCPHWLRE